MLYLNPEFGLEIVRHIAMLPEMMDDDGGNAAIAFAKFGSNGDPLFDQTIDCKTGCGGEGFTKDANGNLEVCYRRGCH